VVHRVRRLAETGASETPESLLTTATGHSSRQSSAAATRASACVAMPPLEQALAHGSAQAGHVDAAAAVHGRLATEVGVQFAAHAEQLARRASQVSVDAFERECRDLARFLNANASADAEVAELERQREASDVKRWVDRSTGMHNTLLSLDPLRDSQLWKVVNAQIARRRQAREDETAATGRSAASFGALQAAAFVDVVVTASAPVASGRGVPEVSVMIDLETLTGDATGAGIVCEADDGTALPVSTVRRLCCDAHVIPLVLGSSSIVLDQGRRVRTATAEQRTAIAGMHRTCAFPACTVDVVACRIHHVRWWWKHRGRTDLDNLIPLCEQHHHLVHEGGWGLVLDAERRATWTRPDGAVHHRGSTLDRRPRDVPLLT